MVKSLRRTGQLDGRPGRLQVGDGAAEERPVGEHRQRGRAARARSALAVGAGVEVGGEVALRRRPPLDLGDHREPAVGAAQRAGEVARSAARRARRWRRSVAGLAAGAAP